MLHHHLEVALAVPQRVIGIEGYNLQTVSIEALFHSFFSPSFIVVFLLGS